MKYLDCQPRFCVNHKLESVLIITPSESKDNLREGTCFATATKHSKCQNKDHNLSAAIQGRGDNIIVLDKELRIMLSEIPLSNKTKQEVHEDSRVDADKEVAHVPADDRQVDVSPEDMGSVSVDDPEWDGNGKANKVR